MDPSGTLIPLPEGPEYRTLVGVLSAVGSMLCWVLTSISFTVAGKRFGSTSVNVTRSVLAAIVLVFVVLAGTGETMPFPIDSRVWLLGISGIFGLAIGDQLIFSAFNRIGPRLTLLILNLVPVCTALLAWPGLGEPLAPLGWIGIAMTVLGVGWVLGERNDPGPAEGFSFSRLGVAIALMGVASVSIGNVLAKHGMVADPGGGAATDPVQVGPLVAQEIRMGFGAIAIVGLSVLGRLAGVQIGTPPVPDASRRPSRSIALGALLIGTALGPILGMILFLYSVLLVKLAVATTVLALTPVAILPLNRLVDRTRITHRALIGAVLGVLGVAVLAFAEPSSDSTPDPIDPPTPAVASRVLD